MAKGSPRRSKDQLGNFSHHLGKRRGELERRGGGESHPEEADLAGCMMTGQGFRDICQALASPGLLSHLLNLLRSCLMHNEPKMLPSEWSLQVLDRPPRLPV